MMNKKDMISIITVRATFNSTKYEILMPSLVKYLLLPVTLQ